MLLGTGSFFVLYCVYPWGQKRFHNSFSSRLGKCRTGRRDLLMTEVAEFESNYLYWVACINLFISIYIAPSKIPILRPSQYNSCPRERLQVKSRHMSEDVWAAIFRQGQVCLIVNKRLNKYFRWLIIISINLPCLKLHIHVFFKPTATWTINSLECRLSPEYKLVWL